MIIVFFIKPKIFFNSQGKMKSFGYETHTEKTEKQNKTWFSYGIFAILWAIICFYIFTLLDININK